VGEPGSLHLFPLSRTVAWSLTPYLQGREMRKIIMTENTYKHYIGIDVSKNKLDVVISSSDTLLQISNNEEGLKELIKHLPSKKNSLIVLEASGGYEKYCANYLRKKKFKVAVVNAKRVREFAKACGKLAKTDGIDAGMIMMFGKTFNPTPQELASDEENNREWYINRRSQLVRILALEKQYAEQSPDCIKKSINKHLTFLEKELALVEEKLIEQFNQDPVLKDKLTRLDEIKGVGIITAMNILIHLPELGMLTAKEASALTGVAPFNQDSGKYKGVRKISGGRAQVRGALYMAILTAVRCNPAIKKFYDRLIGKGKLKKVAMVACMRKLIITMNAMMRDGTSWDAQLI
jgi:transposase